jgi:hypothetical protein
MGSEIETAPTLPNLIQIQQEWTSKQSIGFAPLVNSATASVHRQSSIVSDNSETPLKKAKTFYKKLGETPITINRKTSKTVSVPLKAYLKEKKKKALSLTELIRATKTLIPKDTVLESNQKTISNDCLQVLIEADTEPSKETI